MPCNPLQEASVSAPDPGNFPGSNTFAQQQPDLNTPITSLPLEDLNALFDKLGMLLPSNIIKPHFQPDYLNDVYGAINSILEKFVPFLSLYKFFLPVLNLILCIIEVLCAIPSPFKLISAMRKLFRQCIPEFLSVFPFFAIILMIISLLLLIIALLTYLLQRLQQILAIIRQNIEILGKAAKRADSDSIIAITKKIGDLLCVLQNLFVIFGVILSIIQVIKAILTLSFTIPPCDDDNSSDLGCCTPDVCPDFIKNNKVISSSTGKFQYYNEVGIDSGISLPLGFAPFVSLIRQESWQFYDAELSQRLAFINITNAYDLLPGFSKVFFPAGVSYDATTSHPSTPYTITFTFLYNPSQFGRTDPLGIRNMKIVNAVVQRPPVAYVSSYDNSRIEPFNGTLNLVGGNITEEDGTPILNSDGSATSLNEFIHLPFVNGNVSPFDGVLFENISYEFKINHEVLVGASLITLGCVPDLAEAKNFINATIGGQFNTNAAKLFGTGNGDGIVDLLPDFAAAQDCITNAIVAYRQEISLESTDIFEATINACLNDVKDQATTALTATVAAGVDQYKSTFDIDPVIQFTTLPIQVSVSLNESSGQPITTNLPASAASQIATQITADISLGDITTFTYDGYGSFIANITSDVAGNGVLKVAFNANFISVLTNPTDINQAPSIAIKELTYTFVKSSTFGSIASDAGSPRRDDGDVARD